MKYLGLCITFFLFLYGGRSQTINLQELTGFFDLKGKKLETHLEKKGFHRNGASWVSYDEKLNNTRSIQLVSSSTDPGLIYETTCAADLAVLEEDLKTSGYRSGTEQAAPQKPVLYQKGTMTIECSTTREDTLLYYVIKATQRSVPPPKSLVYAEDLLQLNAHELLVEVFGAKNVVKDRFYFSESSHKPCSIIYPNTDRQAVFVWNDEANLMDLAFIIIGEPLNGRSAKDITAVNLSRWRSNQGVYCGMNLSELQLLNKAPFQFYNWRTDAAGLLAPGSKGDINFDRIKLVFGCMNCGFLSIDKKDEIISSGYALDQNQKVYVATVVIMPEK